MPKQNNSDKIEKIEEKIEKKIERPVKKMFRFLRIDDERQKKIFTEIKERAEADVDFILLTVFSTIIVTLGLLINNAAVVIGGMIIAPLLWPILALALAIIKGNAQLFKKTFFTFLKASFIIFIVSFVIGVFSPFLGNSHEVLLRTKPTLFELFIALAAGFIGAFAVAHPKLSATLAGVVAAVALVPPVAVMGVLFAQGNFLLASGAALLYLTNFIAITFAAVILFLSVGVKFPKTEVGKNMAASNISWFILFLIIISIPLTLIMKDIIKENQQRKVIRDVIEEYTINTDITDLNVYNKKDIVVIQATLRSATKLTSLHVRRLSDILVERLGDSVNLTINVVPTYEVGKNVK